VKSDTAWYAQAACRNVDSEIFFPEQSSHVQHCRQDGINRYCEICWAVQYCITCSVREQCLMFALQQENNAPMYNGSVTRSGIWGGMTGRQRSTYVKHHNLVIDDR